MSISFRKDIEIQAPLETVWAVMSDVERWPEFTQSVRSVTPVRRTGVSLAVGDAYRIRQPGFPPALWHVTSVRPFRSFDWVAAGPGFRTTARHGIESVPYGSIVNLTIEIDGVLSGLFARLSRSITLRYMEMEARGLKEHCETRGS